MLTARRVACAAFVVVVAAACGDNVHPRQPDAAVNLAPPVPLPTVTGTAANSALAINRIVAGLRTHGLDQQITDIIVYTPDTDPSGEMGKPGAYVARATFTDTTLPPAARARSSFARGGTVEFFLSQAAARAFASASTDRLAGEHDLLADTVLLRLAPNAPPTLIDKYRTALNETTGSKVQLLT